MLDMKVSLDINPDELDWYSEEDFKEDIKASVKNKLLTEFDYRWNTSQINVQVLAEEVIKENKQEIIDKVIKEVADRIERKRDIMEMTPKAYELAKIDKENEEYFLKLIDKAIKKRFK